jgi:hypothetical protein
MILAQDLRNQLAFALDAEGSDHYIDSLDYIPAINAAINWMTTIVSSAYGQNKIGEEFFRDLTLSGVFLTNNNSRVSLNVFPNEVWSILGVYVKPTTETIAGAPAPATPNTKQSYYLSNLIHVSSELDCKRLSIEEWARNSRNPLEHGYDGNQICDDLKLYAYLNPITYNDGATLTALLNEIEVRPRLENKQVTIFWVKKPSQIVNITDFIEFPNSVFNMLFDKALNYIAYKQGDQTNIYSVTTADIQQLISVL